VMAFRTDAIRVEIATQLLVVVLDSIDGLVEPGGTGFPAGPIKFYLRVVTARGAHFGFRRGTLFHSRPTGQSGIPRPVDTVPGYSTLANGGFLLGRFSNDGQTDDSIRISGGYPYDNRLMLPPGFNDVLFTLETFVDPGQAGLSLCLDSCRTMPWWRVGRYFGLICLPIG